MVSAALAVPQAIAGLRGRDELGEFAQVLGGGGEEELVSGALGTAEPQAVEFEDPLEVGEEHLDLLPLSSSGDVGVGLGDLARKAPRADVLGLQRLLSARAAQPALAARSR